jgi:hypothetical protein
MSINKNGIGRRSFLKTGAAAAGLGLLADLEAYPQNVNRSSSPSDLKITDMRIAVLRGPGGKGRENWMGGRGAARYRCLLRLPARERHRAARSSSESIPIREFRVTARRLGTAPSRTTC